MKDMFQRYKEYFNDDTLRSLHNLKAEWMTLGEVILRVDALGEMYYGWDDKTQHELDRLDEAIHNYQKMFYPDLFI